MSVKNTISTRNLSLDSKLDKPTAVLNLLFNGVKSSLHASLPKFSEKEVFDLADRFMNLYREAKEKDPECDVVVASVQIDDSREFSIVMTPTGAVSHVMGEMEDIETWIQDYMAVLKGLIQKVRADFAAAVRSKSLN